MMIWNMKVCRDRYMDDMEYEERKLRRQIWQKQKVKIMSNVKSYEEIMCYKTTQQNEDVRKI